MRRKTEDQIARLAFEDLSSAESAKIENEARLDPEATETLFAYRDMRRGLQALADQVPEDQLSTERLRAAILRRGLRPAPIEDRGTNGYGWLMSAVAVGALAFSLVSFRKNAAGHPVQIVEPASHSVLESPGPVAFHLSAPPLRVPPSLPVSPRTVAKASPVESAVAPTLVARTTHHRHHKSVHLNQSVAAHEYVAVNERPAVIPSDKPAPIAAASLEAAEPPKVVDSGTNAVVIIEPDNDSQTGAQRASEVSTTNVVVGG